MKFLFDLLPVILFFATFKWGESHPAAAHELATQYLSGLVSNGVVAVTLAPVLLGTAIAVLATIAQILYLIARRKPIGAMLWLSLVVIGVFGGATIYFQNELFIKWKPTVLYWCTALALLVSQVFFKKNLVRAGMQAQISLPEPVWQKLSFSWIGFLLVMGLLNLYVALNFSTAVWASFKLFGGMGLMFAFVIVQMLMLSKYIEEVK